LSVKSELEFKAIMEKEGWKVLKIFRDPSLTSKDISAEDLNFIQSIKTVFGSIGLPDFLVIKNHSIGFVEVKYKGKITIEQERKISLLQSTLGIWTYIVRRQK